MLKMFNIIPKETELELYHPEVFIRMTARSGQSVFAAQQLTGFFSGLLRWLMELSKSRRI